MKTDRQILDAVYPNEKRCTVCGWTLAAARESGCVEGDCSQRPAPKETFADQLRRAAAQAITDERAAKQLNDLARTSIRTDIIRRWCDRSLAKEPSDDGWDRGHRAALEGIREILSRPVSELDVQLVLGRSKEVAGG